MPKIPIKIDDLRAPNKTPQFTGESWSVRSELLAHLQAGTYDIEVDGKVVQFELPGRTKARRLKAPNTIIEFSNLEVQGGRVRQLRPVQPESVLTVRGGKLDLGGLGSSPLSVSTLLAFEKGYFSLKVPALILREDTQLGNVSGDGCIILGPGITLDVLETMDPRSLQRIQGEGRVLVRGRQVFPIEKRRDRGPETIANPDLPKGKGLLGGPGRNRASKTR